jgi:hypothetical protein
MTLSGDDAARAQSDYVPAAEAACEECEVSVDDIPCFEGRVIAEYRCIPKTEHATILDEAAQITSCDRNRTYGPPRDNHSRTAAMWSAYLGITLTYRDVCLMNVLQKISRDRHCPHRDALVDSAGYLRNIEMADNDEGR